MGLAVSLDEFRQYLSELDERLSVLRQKENAGLSRVDFPIEIYAIGGFSLMYYGLRYSGTEDIDSVKILQEPVKKLIREIALEKEIPIDWLNDIPASRLYYDLPSYRWMDTGWKFENIRLYVIEMEDLLLNKLGVADKVLMQHTDRSHIRDFDDVEGIIDKLGCDYDSIVDLESWFHARGIKLQDYPNVYDKFLERLSDDGLFWPDGHV